MLQEGKHCEDQDRLLEMIHFLTIGAALGLSAGLAPGPLLTLVISETLQHGVKPGVKVALAPVITDLPIILLASFTLAKLSNFHDVLGVFSLGGGLFLLFMGYDTMHPKRLALNTHARKPRSLAKGVLANVLNPHPYLFWFSVGAPTIVKGMETSSMAPLAFISGFYTLLVGSKVLLAILVGKSTSFLEGNVYLYTMRLLGLALCVLAFVLFRDGLKLLGWI
jgi:threonine/homoserine/homoserine lactone efflux protein